MEQKILVLSKIECKLKEIFLNVIQKSHFIKLDLYVKENISKTRDGKGTFCEKTDPCAIESISGTFLLLQRAMSF